MNIEKLFANVTNSCTCQTERTAGMALSKIEHVATLFDTACMEQFHKIRSSGHCLNGIISPVSSQSYDIRQRAHRMFYHSVSAICIRYPLLP